VKLIALSALFAMSVVSVMSLASGSPLPSPQSGTLQIVPAQVAVQCPQAKQKEQILFDLCGDQRAFLQEAQRLAKASNKVVLVSYGADWCIWCHVFEAHILGGSGVFTYATPDGPWTMKEKKNTDNAVQAAALKSFTADHFIVVNIAQETGESGLSVLRDTKAEGQFSGGLPFMYALDQNGHFAGSINSSTVEVRRDGKSPYRGYDRAKLLAALQSLARQKPTK
jgi:Protein of unknown function, DUF255